MKSCPPLDRLSALLRDELSEAQRDAIEDHLELCDACQSRLHSLSGWELSADWPLSSSESGLGSRSRALIDRLAGRPSPGPSGEWKSGEVSRAASATAKEGLPLELSGFGAIREVGRGGMGIVYRAEQRALERPVALKILSEGRMAGASSRERFRREILALARLQHPNVVRIYGVDEHEGLAVLVMEWVEGGDLAHRLRDGPLATRDVVELALPLARALQAAHDQGILHRDLKPANILLSVESGDLPDGRSRLVPKISDFGLAKLVEDGNGPTVSGAVLGTPSYMAPEQTGLLDGWAQGPATDVYGLGAIIYEMLVGRPPFGGSSRHETICQVAAADVVPPRRLRPRVPRDLETICLKCLERDPGRRYATAKQLAEELDRFLDGRPITARRASAWELVAHWGRRKPSEAALLFALIFVFLTGFASVTWLWRLANAEAVRAKRAAEEQFRLRTEAQAEIAARDLDQGIATARGGDIDQGLLWMAESARKSPAQRPELSRSALVNLSAWSESAIPLRAILEHQASIHDVMYSRDGKAILTGSSDGTAQLWDASTGQPLAPRIDHGDQVVSVAISADGRLAATGGTDGKAIIWDPASGRPIGAPLPHGSSVNFVYFSPDGRLLRTHSADNNHRFWDVATGKQVGRTIGSREIVHLEFLPDGRLRLAHGAQGLVRSISTESGPLDRDEPPGRGRIPVGGVTPGRRRFVSHGGDGTIRVWDRGSGEAIGSPFQVQGDLLAVVLSPDGKSVLTASKGGPGRLWDVATGQPLGAPLHQGAGVRTASFSPDGRMVVTGGVDHTARLWDVATSKPLGSPLRHRLEVNHVLFAPDGQSILTTSEDGTAKIWDFAAVAPIILGQVRDGPAAEPQQAAAVPKSGARFSEAVVSPDRTRLLLGDHARGMVRMIATADGQPIGPPLMLRWPYIGAIAFSPDGKRFVVSSYDRTETPESSISSTCQIFDTATGVPTTPILPHINWPAATAFRPDGKVLATGDFSGSVHVWDVETGRSLGPRLAAGSIVVSLAYSPDGRVLAAGTAELANHVMLWDMRTLRQRGDPIRFKLLVKSLAFSPDGSRLAAGSSDTTVRLIDVSTGQAVCEPLRHTELIGGLAFSPVGGTLLSATHRPLGKSVVRLWDATTGQPLSGSLVQPGNISAVEFAPDGTVFATGCKDGSVSFWDVASTRQVGPSLMLRGAIASLSFSPDGAELLAGDQFGRLRTLTVPLPSRDPAGRLIQRVRARTGVEFDRAREVAVLDSTKWRQIRDELSEGDESSEPPRNSDWHEDRARDAEAVGDGFAACWHLDRLIAARPVGGLLHARRALARLLQGGDTPDEVEADLHRAIELGPRDRVVDWIAHRAEDLRASARAADSLRLLDCAVSARPEDWRLHALRAETLAALGRLAERQADLTRALDLGADIPWLIRIADEWSRAGRLSEAIRLYDRAIEQGTVPYEVWERAALTHLANDDEKGYRRLCDTMRSRYPASLSETWVEHGLARVCVLGLGGLGEDGKALQWATRSLTKVPPLSRAHRSRFLRLLGAVHYRSGRYTEAIDSIQQGIADADGQVGLEDAAFLAMAYDRTGDRRKPLEMLARLRADTTVRTRLNYWDAEPSRQLQGEAERLIFGESLPEDVFAP